VGLSWPPEKLRSLGSVLHVCAWGLPAAQTVAALVRRDVDSDELTGEWSKSRNHSKSAPPSRLPQWLRSEKYRGTSFCNAPLEMLPVVVIEPLVALVKIARNVECVVLTHVRRVRRFCRRE
jgi:hypothetical protein